MKHITAIALVLLVQLLFGVVPSTAQAQPTVTLTSVDTSAAEADLDQASFTLTRTDDGNTTAALQVRVALDLTSKASINVDYSITPFTHIIQPDIYQVTIPANQLSATVTLTPYKDNLIEDVEAAAFTLISNGTSYTIGSDTDAEISISDDTAEVNLTLNDGSAAESDLNTGSFTVTRSSNGKLDAPLHIRVTRDLTSTASYNVDYSITPFTFIIQPDIHQVTIPANQLSATVTLTPYKDNLIEDVEAAAFTLISDGTTYTIGSDTDAEISISDDTAEVNLTLNDGSAAESDLNTGSFTVTRSSNGKLDAPLHIRVTRDLTSTASYNVDYSITPFTFIIQPDIHQVTIPANQLSATVTLTPYKDNLIEDVEAAAFTLISDGTTYTIGSDTDAEISISDDTAEVNLTLNDGSTAESDLNTGSFTVTRSSNGKLNAPLHIRVTRDLTSTASYNVDYSITPFTFIIQPDIHQVTIPANQLSATVTLTPYKDNLIEDVEAAAFTLISDGTTYTIGSDTDAEISISDDTAEVNLTLNDGSAAESDLNTGSFTVTRSSNGKLDAPLHIRVTRDLTSTASYNVDYSITPFTFIIQPDIHQVTIPANQLSATVTLTPYKDNLIEDVEAAAFTLISDGTTYTIGSDTDAEISISDDTAEVNLTLNDGSAAESDLNTGSFTVTRSSNGKLDAPLHIRVTRDLTSTASYNVDYSITPFTFIIQPDIHQVTIPANQLSATVTLTPIKDSNETEGDETAEFNLIGDDTTYTVGSLTNAVITIIDSVDLIFGDGFESNPL